MIFGNATRAIVGLAIIGCGRSSTVDGGSIKDVGVETDGSAIDGSISSADPAGIFGTKLVLWLDANEPTTITLDPDAGNRVAVWKDRSSFANDTFAVYVNGDGRITLNPTAANGRPAVVMRGPTDGGVNYDGVLAVKNYNVVLAPGIVVMVVAYDNLGGPVQLLGPTPGNTGGLVQLFANVEKYGVVNNKTFIYGGIGPYDLYNTAHKGVWTDAGSWNDGTLHTICLRIDALTSKLLIRVDGNEDAASISFGGGGGGLGFQIGGQTDKSAVAYPLNGHIAEVLVADGTFGTDGELVGLSAYFKKKYGLSF